MKTKYVYAIYPKDENGNIAGVYVGSTVDIKMRINAHKNLKVKRKANDPQYELHQLMRDNGFSYEVLDTITDDCEDYKEYKWMEVLSKKYPKVFNKYLGIEYEGKVDDIGNKIYQYLVQHDILVYELVKETQIKSLRMAKILRNYSKINVIEYYKICKALQLPLNYFLEGVSA